MAKRDKKGRKLKTPEQLEAEARDHTRATLMEAGVPAIRVEGKRLNDFRVEPFTDIVGHRKERRSVFKAITPLDKWFDAGGPGFEDPQRRAIDHCRKLWASIGSRRLTANYAGVGGGQGDAEDEFMALAQLAEYKSDIPVAYWSVFENVVRFEMPAGVAGAHLARNPAQQQAHAKSCVGFVASLIAMWRGY